MDFLNSVLALLLESLRLIIPAAGALVVAWLVQRTRQISAARAAVTQVEERSYYEPMTSEQKLAAAQQIIAEKNADKHAAVIEKVLPQVRADVHRRRTQPPPAG